MAQPRMTTQTLAVLSTMLGDEDADWYGLDLSKRSGLKPGTIYPILDRLLKAGWLEREWEDIDPVSEGRTIQYLVPPPVAGYIAQHGLYTGEAWARN